LNLILKQVGAGDKHFVDGTHLYSQDTHALNAWNALMGDNALAVYRVEEQRSVRWKKTELKVDSTNIFVVLKNGKVLKWSVSEWSAMTHVGNVSPMAFMKDLPVEHVRSCGPNEQ
jgi:hypothetical protein